MILAACMEYKYKYCTCIARMGAVHGLVTKVQFEGWRYKIGSHTDGSKKTDKLTDGQKTETITKTKGVQQKIAPDNGQQDLTVAKVDKIATKQFHREPLYLLL